MVRDSCDYPSNIDVLLQGLDAKTSNVLTLHRDNQPLLTVRTGSEGTCLDSQGGSVVHLSRYNHLISIPEGIATTYLPVHVSEYLKSQGVTVIFYFGAADSLVVHPGCQKVVILPERTIPAGVDSHKGQILFDLTKACKNHSIKEIARLILETVGERVDIHGCD